MPGLIASIERNSIAQDLGWQPGDEIVSINGHVLHDIIDYLFYSSDEFLTVLVRRGNQDAEFEIEKDIDTSLGVEFKDTLFDGIRTCGASCIFCFVDQLPKGLRKSLYLKDDDFRLSFLHGNFITMANMDDADLNRIVTQRLSPLYVSVHTTDHALRERMLGRKCPDILAQIDALAPGRIVVHTQIVLCPGVNDGENLQRTIEDLASRRPTVASIAIVPAAVTERCKSSVPICAVDAQYAVALLKQVRCWQRRFLREKGTRLVWAADEFYLYAGWRVPKTVAYEGFPQLENGVGLVRLFKNSAYRASRTLPDRLSRPLAISIVTGTLAAPLLRNWAASLQMSDLSINVYPIRNRLLGESVSVAGLVAGADIIDQLRGVNLGDAVFVPTVALRDGAFLDDLTVEDVESALGCRVEPIAPLPHVLARRIIELSCA